MSVQSEESVVARLSAEAFPIPAWKRVLDLACLALTFPCWMLLGLCVGLLVKLTSPGPVLFRQKRIGYLGRPFWCYKFRTMKLNADISVHQDHLAHGHVCRTSTKRICRGTGGGSSLFQD